MRAAAGYRSDDASVGLGATPNLPGYRNPQHQLEMSRPRRSSLKYVKGFPIVEDLPPSPPAGYGISPSTTLRPSPDIYDQGSPSPPPLAHYPPTQQQLQQQQAALQRQLQQLQLQQEALQQQEAQAKLAQEQQQRARLAAPAAAAAAAGVGAENAGRLSTSRGVLQWNGVKTPGWLLFDRKVLRFHAYSCDRVPYSPVEEIRVRYFDIFYHMEDGSMEMVEPQAENSGLVQGKYLNRHKAKLPNGQPLTHNELRVGQELQLYGRKFMITGCDAATRAFYQELGQPQAPNFSAPEDQYIQSVKAAKAAEEQRRLSRSRPKTAEDTLFDQDLLGPGAVFKFERDNSKQVELDGKVLRFFACWDDTKSTFGQKLPFVIYYYLVNDTVEVAENHVANTGRDPFPLLLKRCQLPKAPNIPPVGGRPMSPNSKKALNIQYYNWRDMRTGSMIYVYGRPLFIYDMDSYTRRWMIEQGGLNPAEVQPIFVDFHMGPKRPPLQIPPDMLRIGAEEDSRRNVLSLIPKPPPFDAAHFLENWNKVMRFSARMVPVPGRPLWDPRDADRRFIISYFMLNQTISIFEPRRPNTGIPGGKFLERVKVKKEGEDGYITDQDLQIGKIVPIFARYWELLDADHNTCKYMEMHKDRYPHADYDKVMDKVVESLYSRPGAEEELRQALIEEDRSGLGYVTKQQLHAALLRAGVHVSLHEATTIVRTVGADLVGVVCEQLLRAIQAHAGYAPSSAAASERDLGDDLGVGGGPHISGSLHGANGSGYGGAGEGEGGFYGGGGNGSGGAYNGYNGSYSGPHNNYNGGLRSSLPQPGGAAAPSFTTAHARSESPPAISPPSAAIQPSQPLQPPQPTLMPGYAPGSMGPLNDPPPPRPSSLHNSPNPYQLGSSTSPHDLAAQLAHARIPPAGGSAQVGGAPYQRPRAWADPSPLSEEPDALNTTYHGAHNPHPLPNPDALSSGLASPASGFGSGYGSGYASPPVGAGNGGYSGYNGSYSGGYNCYSGPANGGSKQSVAEPELSLREMAAARNGGVGVGGSGASGQSAVPPLSRTAWADESDQAGLRPSPPASEPPQSRPSSSYSGPDPRFQRPPGGVGYTPRSKAGPYINPNRSSLDVLSKVPQPKSLWQTSNQAIGGIFNPKSAAQNHKLAASWNGRV